MKPLLRFLGLGPLLACSAALAGDGSDDYLKDIKPLFQKRCYACHGALKQKSGLRLDTAASVRRGGDGGPAVEPGNSGESLLIEKITESDASLRMPPEGEPVKVEEVARIKAWIDAGAGGPADEAPQQDPRRHWAFVPPERPPVPSVA